MQILSEFATRGALREVDRQSIRAFIACNKYLLRGTVLDFGAGLQPYRDLVEGRYIPFTPEHASTPAGSPATGPFTSIRKNYNAILCTQVAQYLENPSVWFTLFAQMLWEREGHLVMTYPANWPEDEAADIQRFTKSGMELALRNAGFSIVNHTCRGVIKFTDFEIPFGYGVVARIGAK